MACSAVPEVESAAPTRIARRTRGSRISLTMIENSLLGEDPRRADHTSPKDIDTLPKLSAARLTTIRARTRTMVTIRTFRRVAATIIAGPPPRLDADHAQPL